jgi:hypothetical protein
MRVKSYSPFAGRNLLLRPIVSYTRAIKYVKCAPPLMMRGPLFGGVMRNGADVSQKESVLTRRSFRHQPRHDMEVILFRPKR